MLMFSVIHWMSLYVIVFVWLASPVHGIVRLCLSLDVIGLSLSVIVLPLFSFRVSPAVLN